MINASNIKKSVGFHGVPLGWLPSQSTLHRRSPVPGLWPQLPKKSQPVGDDGLKVNKVLEI